MTWQTVAWNKKNWFAKLVVSHAQNREAYCKLLSTTQSTTSPNNCMNDEELATAHRTEVHWTKEAGQQINVPY